MKSPLDILARRRRGFSWRVAYYTAEKFGYRPTETAIVLAFLVLLGAEAIERITGGIPL